jgi:formylglycine-generating enzyme required for sulfatase activity
MAHIPAGTFTMGSPVGEPGRAGGNAELQHQVTLTKNFFIGIYAITQEQYQAVMGANPSSFSNPAAGEEQARRPVERVSWYDTLVFCNLLSILEGLTPVYSINGSTDPATWGAPTGSDAAWNAVTADWDADGYRLPTEAEWEYACRAGTAAAWYTGNTADAALDAAAWYGENSGNMTREVGLKTPNAWGLYDMHGNVQEWCWNWWESYTEGAKTDPRGPETGTGRVRRGGSWGNGAQYLRSAYRNNGDPSLRVSALGFRVVRYQ